jgi:hypothetical protein
MFDHFHDPIGRPTHGPNINFHPPKELLFAPVAKAASVPHRSAHLPPLAAQHPGVSYAAVSHALRRAVRDSAVGRIASRLGLSSHLRSLIGRLVEKVVAAFEGL